MAAIEPSSGTDRADAPRMLRQQVEVAHGFAVASNPQSPDDDVAKAYIWVLCALDEHRAEQLQADGYEVCGLYELYNQRYFRKDRNLVHERNVPVSLRRRRWRVLAALSFRRRSR